MNRQFWPRLGRGPTEPAKVWKLAAKEWRHTAEHRARIIEHQKEALERFHERIRELEAGIDDALDYLVIGHPAIEALRRVLPLEGACVDTPALEPSTPAPGDSP